MHFFFRHNPKLLVLTPVNEYNIVDKIQSANNQLFNEEQHIMDIHNQTTDNCTKIPDKLLLQSKHRVTFSSDIEEYEDDISEEEVTEIQYKDDEAIDKEIAEIIASDEKPTIENEKIDGLMKKLSIDEAYSNDDGSGSEENDITEVEVMDESNINESNRLEMLVPTEEQIINNSNVDKSKEKEKIIVPLNSLASLNGDEPPCRACNKINNTSSTRQEIKRPTTSQISTGFKKSNVSTTNRIVSAHIHRKSDTETTNQDDVLKIHLNVRACCENKYLDNNRLPRYNGYISQYGLSKDQLEQREANRQKYAEKRARKEREIMRAKQEIAELNEQAFRQWLIRKNHVTRPKCKNMYDEDVPKLRIKYHPSKKFPKSNGHL